LDAARADSELSYDEILAAAIAADQEDAAAAALIAKIKSATKPPIDPNYNPYGLLPRQQNAPTIDASVAHLQSAQAHLAIAATASDGAAAHLNAPNHIAPVAKVAASEGGPSRDQVFAIALAARLEDLSVATTATIKALTAFHSATIAAFRVAFALKLKGLLVDADAMASQLAADAKGARDAAAAANSQPSAATSAISHSASSNAGATKELLTAAIDLASQLASDFRNMSTPNSDSANAARLMIPSQPQQPQPQALRPAQSLGAADEAQVVACNRCDKVGDHPVIAGATYRFCLDCMAKSRLISVQLGHNWPQTGE
jgi:hypothetical protein